MKDPEITKLNDKELQDKLRDERAMLTKLRLQHGVSPVENPQRIPTQKKLIAKILTEVSERTISKGIPAEKTSAKK